MHVLVIRGGACRCSAGARASRAADRPLHELVNRPVPLRTGIGAAHDAGVHVVEAAQAFYDQGLAYLHSYVWLEAARSFNQALRADPKLAMAHLGLTIAYTELNAPAAAQGGARAREGAGGGGERPRSAAHRRAHAAGGGGRRARADATRLPDYRTALDAALAAYPQDEELWLLRGLAESPDPAERGQGSVAGRSAFYEKALALAPGHFAAHHYLTHAYENTGRIAEALAEGATYAKMAPAVPHARHMYGHNCGAPAGSPRRSTSFAPPTRSDASTSGPRRSGRVRLALPAQSRSAGDVVSVRRPDGEGRGAVQDGVRDPVVARGAGVQQARVAGVSARRAGAPKEALDAAHVLAGAPVAGRSAIGHVEAGRARLALGQFKAAADEANAALRLMRGAPEGAGLVATPLKALQGEFFLRTGKTEQGRPMLEEVARKVRAAPGPDAWTQALFTLEAIARAAREVGDWELRRAGPRVRCSSTIRTTRARTTRSRSSPNTTGMPRRPAPNGRWRRNTGAGRTRDCRS